jgi:hypothetical protein
MVCATLMCALDGTTDASLTQIKNRLGLKPGQTSADGLFSCEKVECLADCDQPPVVQKDNEHFCKMKGPALDAYIDSLLAKEGKTVIDYTGIGAAPPVATDLRIAVLPPHYNFPGESETGAREFDDKDAYLAPGEGSRVTTVPPPLKTPLTAPVAGTSFVKPSKNGQNGGHHG